MYVLGRTWVTYPPCEHGRYANSQRITVALLSNL
jgi:hypothetical protein